MKIPRLIVLLLLLVVGFSLEASEPSGAAMWVYKTGDLIAKESARIELFDFCKQRGITELFLQTHYALSAERRVMIGDAAQLRVFLGEANENGLNVHALSGEPSYVAPENHFRALAQIDAVLEFNRSAAIGERFAGVHFDIEPHGLKSWKDSDAAKRVQLLTQLVEVCAKASERLHASTPELKFGADVTFWFDKSQPDGSPVYPVSFHGVSKDATKHLLDLCDNIGIMSYRRKTDGPNSISAIVEQTISYADGAKARAYVGVKMADIGPEMEGFFGLSEEQMQSALEPVITKYRSHRGFAGLAYFTYEAYRVMPQGNQ